MPSTGKFVEAATKPTLTRKSAKIVVGGKTKIKIKNVPKRAKITYKSTKTNIASVSKKGRIKALKNGTAKINVIIKKNYNTTKLTYKVVVKKPKLVTNKLSLLSGTTAKLSVKNKPKKAKYIWKSSNSKIAKVNKNGTVTAISNGITTINLKIRTAKKTYRLSCKITVQSESNNSNEEKQTYVILFDSNDGSIVASQTVSENGTANQPADPIRSGFRFAGWYTSPNGGQAFDFHTPITGDTILYAHWIEEKHTYTILFDSNGGSVVASQTVSENGTANQPADPIRSGFRFAGWYASPNGGQAFDFHTAITSDTILYAHWLEEKQMYTILFDSNGGTVVASQTVSENGTANQPADPIRNGFRFTGWYTSPDEGQAFDFSTAIAGDIKLYAHWVDENFYVLSFNLNYNGADNTIQDQLVKGGTTASEPEEPKRDGYVFRNWYLDASGNNYFSFNTCITDDIVLYAGWIKKEDLSASNKMTQEDYKRLSYEMYEKQKVGSSTLDLSSEKSVISVDVKYKLENGTGNVEITPIDIGSSIYNTVGLVGTPIDINLIGNDNLENATVAFTYNDKMLPSDTKPGSLSAAWYDPGEECMKLIDSTVNTEAKTISFETSHFSEYCLVNTDAWFDAWSREQLIIRDSNDPKANTFFNVVFALDTSGSMSNSDIAFSHAAASAFMDELMDEDYVAIVSFNSRASVLVPPCHANNSREEIESALNSLTSNGGTNFNAALDTTIQAFSEFEKRNSSNPVENILVFMSDGQSSVSSNVLDSFSAIDATAITVGIGSGAKESELRKIADASKNGQYVYCSSSEDLIQAFERIQAKNIGSRNDTDGDGLPDIVETSGMRDQYGNINYTDPNNPDTDGDGFSDGYEIGSFINNNSSPYFKIISSPTTPTFQSDKVKLSVIGEATESFLDVENFSDFSGFSTRKVNVKISTKCYEMAQDYLSDVVYMQQPSSFEISCDPSDIDIRNVETSFFTSGTSNSWNISFDACVKKEKLKDFKGSIIITPDKGEPVKTALDIDFYWDWRRYVYQYVNKQKHSLEIDTGKIVSAINKDINDESKAFEDNVVLSTSDAPKAVKEWLDDIVAGRLREQAEEDFDKLFTSADRIVNDCWKSITKDDTVLKPTISGIQYEIEFHQLGVMQGGYFSATITQLNQPNKKYSYGATNSEKNMKKAIENYIERLKVLHASAITDCVEALIEDTSDLTIGAAIDLIIEYKNIPKVISAWKGANTSSYVNDVLKGAGIKFVSCKALEELYNKLTKTENKIDTTSSWIFDDSASIDDVASIADRINSISDLYDKFLGL